MLILAALACSRPAPVDDFGPAPNFSLTDHTGTAIDQGVFGDHLTVVDFIFTTCRSACPMLTAQMATLDDELPATIGTRDLQFLSVTVDPETDTPPVLAAYADQHGASPAPRWRFVTGDRPAIDAVIAGFRLATERVTDAQGNTVDILHSNRFVLVGPDGHVRGMHPTDSEGIAALKRDLTALGR